MAYIGYYNGFDVKTIDADGVSAPVALATLDIIEVATGLPLGTAVTDDFGYLEAATVTSGTLADGSEIEFSNASYPNSFRRTVMDTLAKAWALTANFQASFVAEDLSTARTAAAVETWLIDLSNPDSKPVRLGFAPTGAMTPFKYETLTASRNLRVRTNPVTDKLERKFLRLEDAPSTDFVAAATLVAGVGSVTSVAMSVPSALLAVSGSPITSSGTFAVTLPTRTANQVFAGPTGGGAATPTFRALVAADIPQIPISTGISGLGANVATWLATPTSTNLRTAVAATSTGTGSLVFHTAPTFATSIDISSGGAYMLAGANVIRTPGTNFYFGTGGNTSTNPSNNLIFGSSGSALTTGGAYNVLIGVPAAADITTGTDNMCIGVFAGWKTTSGASNVFIGSGAGSANTIASFNTCVGREAGDAMKTSQYNTCIGRRAGRSMTTDLGASTQDGMNTFIGAHCSLTGITTGRWNTIIGAQVAASSNVSNTVIIGDGAGNHRINVDSNGRVGFGTGETVSARCHSLSTTEQLRLGYDTSNYFSTTVSSTGGVTFDAVGSGAGFTFSDSITLADAKDISCGTGTGTKIGTSTSQKIGFWNATPIVQPTTAIAAATFVANTSGIADDTATFDGYKLGQIVKALRNMGKLA